MVVRAYCIKPWLGIVWTDDCRPQQEDAVKVTKTISKNMAFVGFFGIFGFNRVLPFCLVSKLLKNSLWAV